MCKLKIQTVERIIVFRVGDLRCLDSPFTDKSILMHNEQSARSFFLAVILFHIF